MWVSLLVNATLKFYYAFEGNKSIVLRKTKFVLTR